MPTDDTVAFELVVDGVGTRATYTRATVDGVLEPLVSRWDALWREGEGRRVVVFLAAPPGAGKSTLAHVLEKLSSGHGKDWRLQALPLDGFHYHQEFLESHRCVVEGHEVSMRDVKGTLETFDYQRFSGKLDELRCGGGVLWPVYDRKIHDVVEDALKVTEPVVLIEGNWLLSTESPWDGASSRADDTVFLSADESMLHERLVARKMRGGLSADEAERWYVRTDGMNVRRVMGHRQRAAVELSLVNNQGSPCSIIARDWC